MRIPTVTPDQYRYQCLECGATISQKDMKLQTDTPEEKMCSYCQDVLAGRIVAEWTKLSVGAEFDLHLEAYGPTEKVDLLMMSYLSGCSHQKNKTQTEQDKEMLSLMKSLAESTGWVQSDVLTERGQQALERLSSLLSDSSPPVYAIGR